MDRKIKRGSKAIYLNVNSPNRQNKQKTQIINKVKSQLVLEKDGIPIKKEFVDISLSCDYIFQYLLENRCVNKNYFTLNNIVTYLTLMIINVLILSFLLYTRNPFFSFENTCFNSKSYSYETCTYRSWCKCDDFEKCVYICYEESDVCIKNFIKEIDKSDTNFITWSTVGTRIYLRFDTHKSNINVFDKISDGYCNIYNNIMGIILGFFSGGISGCYLFGILSDRFGKKIVILCQSFLLVMTLIFISIYSNRKFTDYDNFTYFLCIWVINGFFLGGSLFSLEYVIYIQFLENHPDVNSLSSINGYMNTHFAFSGGIIFFFNNVIQNLSYLFYFSVIYFLCLFFFFWFYFVENPRYFSERVNNLFKKNSLERILEKTLIIKKKENGEEEKYWKKIVFYDSTSQRIVGEEIKEKVKNVKDEEIDYYINNSRQTGSNKKSRLNKNNSNLINNPESLKKNENNNKENNQSNLTINQGLNSINLNEYYDENGVKTEDIYRKYNEDKYLNDNFYIFLVCWVAIYYCMFGISILYIMEINNPSIIKISEGYGIFIYSFFMTLIFPVIIGIVSNYFSQSKIIYYCLATYSVLCISIDLYRLYPDVDRIGYFGYPYRTDIYVPKDYLFSKATNVFIIVTVYSIFNLLTINSAPTLYRTLFLSHCHTISKLAAFLGHTTGLLLDTPSMNLGIIGALTSFVFLWVDIKWKDLKLLEYVDSDQNDIKKKREIQNNKVNFNQNEDRKSRTNSIFTRLRNFSIRKMKKQ